MKRFMILLFMLMVSTASIGQSKEIQEIIANKLDNIYLQARLNRIALSSGIYKEGQQVKISTSFNIDENGNLIHLKVRAPLPQLEIQVANELRQIKIPKELLISEEKPISEVLYGMPIFLSVLSDKELNRTIEKEKRKQEKEKRKAEKKNI